VRAVDRWRSLDAAERRVTIRGALTIIRAIAILKVGGVRRAVAWADRAPCVITSPQTPASIVRAVDRAGRYLPGSTCLAKSLALVRVLRRTGMAAEVRFGTRRGDQFEAHAWVECDGQELTGSNGAAPFEPVTAATRTCLPRRP
jgi:transglutaminase-like putative cysteine protease